MSKVFKIKYNCVSNGKGIRTAIFLSGCNLHCKGCFNEVAWNFNSGFDLDEKTLTAICNSIEPDYIEGISILGGEPLDVKNQKSTYDLCKRIKENYTNKTIWLWTGYVFDSIPRTGYTLDILKYCDVIIDGPWIQELYSPNLKFRGSSNQRILNLKNGKIIGIEK